MKKVNLSDIPFQARKSPKGRFQFAFQNISNALAGVQGSGTGVPGQPFDLELMVMPPSATNYPYHSHSAQWEMYIVLSGSGQARTPDGVTDIREGDVFLCPPNEPHQIVNTGDRDLKYYVIADNPVSDICYYPDSDKWALPDKIVKVTEADYYDGEE